MKKLWMVAVISAMVLASCCNKDNNKCNAPKDEPKQPAPQECQMSEEQKTEMKDWNNWNSLSETRKTELLNKRKACYDKMKAEEAEREANKAKFEEQMKNWNKLTIDQRKAAFDLVGCCPMQGCKSGGPDCGPGHQGPDCHGGPKDGKAPQEGDKQCCKDKK